MSSSVHRTKRSHPSALELYSKRHEIEPFNEEIFKVIERSFAVWKKLPFNIKKITKACPHFFIKYDPKSGEWIKIEENTRYTANPQTLGQTRHYLCASYQAPRQEGEKPNLALAFPLKQFQVSMGALKVIDLICRLILKCSKITKFQLFQNYTNSCLKIDQNTDAEKKYIPNGKLTEHSQYKVQRAWTQAKDRLGDSILGKGYMQGSFDTLSCTSCLKESELVAISNIYGGTRFARIVTSFSSSQTHFKVIKTDHLDEQSKVIARWHSS